MPGDDPRTYSVLIVSGTDKFTAEVRRAASGRRISGTEALASASSARRRLIERDVDIVVICCPLPDEFGHELAMDIAGQSAASVIVSVPQEVYGMVLDNVTDHGIQVLARPSTGNELERALRFAAAIQDKVGIYREKLSETAARLEETRAVSRAKLLLMQERGMTEDEAHRYIGREAMNSGVSRRRAAERIMDELE